MLNLIKRGSYNFNNIRENTIDFDIIDKVCNDITTETLHDVGQLILGGEQYHIANMINSNVFLQDEIIWFEYKKSKFIIDKKIRLEDCKYIIINKNPIMRFIMIPDFDENFDIIRSVSSSSVARTSYNRFITFFINESIYNDNVNESNLVNLLIHIIDEIIMFMPLAKAEIREIVKLQISAVSRILAKNDISLKITDSALDLLADEGYDAEYGARPVKRVIQRDILNRLSCDILSGNVSKDETICIDAANNRFIFRNE